MDEARAMLELPRHPSQVYGELLAAEKDCEVFGKMAADIYALDARPLLYNPATREVTPLGELDLPPELKEALRDAHERRTRLQFEWRDARRRYD